ncbi:hypothetical protein [Enterobacter hormaechei]|uniref:hypothetical protein n=1 Tax=Enterobacter hormaechei TaxID=158836 RepID=UPI0012B8C882|nr:hypothetical protein [Enterobacter hormaechei]
MSKSLKSRCIRRWEVEFKGRCDSKFSMVWRKHHLRGYIRQCALTTAECMVENMAYSNAKVDYDGGGNGWSPEFGSWYDERREQYRNEALSYLNEEATTDEIDEEIEAELDAWYD